MQKEFEIPVSFMMSGIITVKAETHEEALEIAEKDLKVADLIEQELVEYEQGTYQVDPDILLDDW